VITQYIMGKENMNNSYIILSSKIARKLIKDYRFGKYLLDIKPNKNNIERTVFVFESNSKTKTIIESLIQK